MTTITKRRGRSAPSKEQLDGIGVFVTRRTSELREQGLRFDWSRLTEDEQSELVALQVEAEGEEASFDLGRLSGRKASRWERLVGQAFGKPDFFEGQRVGAEIRAIVAAASRQAARRSFSRREEVTFMAVVAKQLEGRILWADQAAVLFVIAAQWENGAAFPPHGRVERRDGFPALIVDPGFGLVGANRDPHGSLAAWKSLLPRLEEIAWISVDRRGNEWAITPGDRMKKVLALAAKRAA